MSLRLQHSPEKARARPLGAPTATTAHQGSPEVDRNDLALGPTMLGHCREVAGEEQGLGMNTAADPKVCPLQGVRHCHLCSRPHSRPNSSLHSFPSLSLSLSPYLCMLKG